MGWFFDYGYVILAALILIGGFLFAGYKTKSSGMIAFGYMFAFIMLTVFATEGISKWFLPEHLTISNSFGKFLGNHPIAGWSLLASWIAFCISLAVHLALQKPRKD